MPDYRLYHLDRHSGHIRTAETFDAPDDESAREQIRQRALSDPLELWSGSRKVERFEARPELPPEFART